MDLHHLLLLLLTSATCTAAQPPTPDDLPPVQSSFRPNVAVLIAIFSILFSLAFLLLMYTKFCHSGAHDFFSHHPTGGRGLIVFPPHTISYNTSDNAAAGDRAQRSFSGIDRSVVESLPFFRFSSLRGSRDGLECAVCLSKFDDEDVLRLLPKCKHAFHAPCVDRWLECHSTCPLCRYRIDPDDANAFKCSNSSRFLFRDHQGLDDVEIFVEREPDRGNRMKDELLIAQNKEMHRFNHRIVASDVVFKSRWSDMNSSDFVALNSEMLNLTSSKRFRANDGEENSSDCAPARCMSEMTNVSRFQGVKNSNSISEDDERLRRVWLPMARRTVQLFAGKESGAAEFQHHRGEDSNV